MKKEMTLEQQPIIRAYWTNEIQLNNLVNQANASIEAIAESPNTFDPILVGKIEQYFERKKELLQMLGRLQKKELAQSQLVDLTKYRQMILGAMKLGKRKKEKF